MEIDGEDYTALATGGDVYLGGLDWDRRIADYIAEQFVARHGACDLHHDATAQKLLLRDAEEAKRSLSAREEVNILFNHAGRSVNVPLSRRHLESLTQDLLDRTRFTTQAVLRESRLGWKDLTRLLLVGGSTRMPMVSGMLERETGLKTDRSLSADEAVAHGAAIYAGLLESRRGGGKPPIRIRNVNSHNLGVLGTEDATGRPRTAVMIPRNTALPATHASRFHTKRHNQRSVAVPIIEGGDAAGNNSTRIGTCIVRDLPPNLPAGTVIDVFFTYADNGRLTVRGRLPDQNREAELTIERASGLSDARLAEWDTRLRERRI